MNLLLDTHVLLWWLDDHSNLSHQARLSIANSANTVFISAVVIWEIRIKQALGKLMIPLKFQQVLKQQRFEMLPVTAEHAHAIKDLPSYHRDPFDRMLVVQAKMENLVLVTRDSQIAKYEIPIIQT